jgi:Flp pilus assembly CpaF family ATPase
MVPPALALLEPLLADPSVVEITVDRPDHRIFPARLAAESGIRFASPEDLRTAIKAALALGGCRSNQADYCRGAPSRRLARLAVLPPAVDGPYLVLRKIYRNPITEDQPSLA